MILNQNDTIVAPATVPGTGAISVVRLSGPDSLSVASSVLNKDLRSADGYSAHYCSVVGPEGAVLDDVVVTVFRSPRSYTGEDSVEISCHASAYIVRQLIMMLVAAGARSAGPGEFTQRAFVNGKMDLAQAEAVADLIASQNEAAHRVAMNQMRGGFSSELKVMRDKLLEITSLMELELDFSEEEVEFADRSQLRELVDSVASHVQKLTSSFRLGNAIKNGVPVAIVGATNSGKSTLLNALLEEDRAIVSDIEGTTRDTIEESIIIADTQFRFIDTAGIRETSEVIERLGIERSINAISLADIVLVVLDSSKPSDILASEANLVISKLDTAVQKVIFVLNKADLGGSGVVNKNVNYFNKIVSLIDSKSFNVAEAPFVFISAKNGYGMSELRDLLLKTQSGRVSEASSTLVSNVRHYEALLRASESLESVRRGLELGIPTDLVAQDLRETLHHLGSITGQEIGVEEVLGEIFSRFCIGK